MSRVNYLWLLCAAQWASLNEAFVVPQGSSRPVFAAVIQSSSSSDNNNIEDDEISKLIGKRSQIKRKRKEDEVAEPTTTEPLRDLDLDKLPEFKTERPIRRATPKEEKDEDAEKKDESSSKYDAPIIDFQAGYDDENDLHIPNRIGITTVAWGNSKRSFVAKGKLTKRAVKAGKFVPGDLQLAFDDLLASGVTFMETSGSYGGEPSLNAHKILQTCLGERPDGIPEPQLIETFTGGAIPKALATATLNMATTTENVMVNGLEASLGELGDLASVELFQVPYSWYTSTSALSTGLAAVLESGQANAVGVVGVTSGAKLQKLCRQLSDADYSLTSNAFDFSLTNRKNEGLIEICKQLNVIPLITNPLDDGLASGVITATNPTGGGRGALALSTSGKQYSFKQLDKYQPLHSVMETVAERVRTRVMRGMRDTQDRFKPKYGPAPQINTDITTTQVALQYVIAKGGVPLPEVNSPAQAKEVLGCLGWTLDDEEVTMLDSAAALSSLK